SHYDLFEGKYYGSLVPWLEARRYIYIHLLTLGLAGIGSGSFLLTLLSLIAAYSFYNFMLHSAHLGLLAGISSAARMDGALESLRAAWRYCPHRVQIPYLILFSIAFAPPLLLLASRRVLFVSADVIALALTLGFFLPFNNLALEQRRLDLRQK